MWQGAGHSSRSTTTGASRRRFPILILNATTLNTGHNWQFTTSFMGESPLSIDPEVDGNNRLRRLYYDDAPTEELKQFRLARAVGASACVPVLFEPIAVRGLYPDKTVRLADGGVHDNQGIVGLLEQDCTVMLVSDASGQVGVEDDPNPSELSVAVRSNDLLMARVRGAQYRDLKARLRSRGSRPDVPPPAQRSRRRSRRLGGMQGRLGRPRAQAVDKLRDSQGYPEAAGGDPHRPRLLRRG